MSLSTLIVWIIVGAVSGWVASMVMNTDASMGALSNIIVGIIGSFLGGFLVILITQGNLAFTDNYLNLNWGSFFVSILGSVVLLWLIRMFRGSPAS